LLSVEDFQRGATVHHATPTINLVMSLQYSENTDCATATESGSRPQTLQHEVHLEGQHPLTGQRAANFRLLANQ